MTRLSNCAEKWGGGGGGEGEMSQNNPRHLKSPAQVRK